MDASHRTQLIVTTQSNILVDALSETPDAILVCEKYDGSTTMKRLKKEDLS
jgi:predicted ATPase